MGASKRMAELVCQSARKGIMIPNSSSLSGLGNVLVANGSVVPKFRSKRSRRADYRYPSGHHPFFHVDFEAAQLVLQAGLMGQHGENLRARHGQTCTGLSIWPKK